MVDIMVLVTLLAIIAIFILTVIFVAITLGIIGTAGFIYVFGDAILAILIVVGIVKLIRRHK